MNEVRDEQRGSVSNENNILLDPDVVTDPMSQVDIFFLKIVHVNISCNAFIYENEYVFIVKYLTLFCSLFFL